MARTTIPAELVAINAIQGTLIADNAITAVHIATNAVSGTLVADNAITSTHIAQNQVTATQIAQNTITVGQIADSAVETAKLNNDAVTQAKIADDAVGADQLAANSVVSASIVNGTIVEADMADNAVTLAKMASLARGSIIVGDSAGDPSALSIGSNTYVLTSDGTDISWAAASGGLSTSGGTLTGQLVISSAGGDGSANIRLVSTASDSFNWASEATNASLTSGEYLAHIFGKEQASKNSAHIAFKYASDHGDDNALQFGFYGVNDIMNIYPTGSVGIGATSPGALLDVNNTTAADNRTVAIFEGQGNGSSQADGGQYVSITRTGPISNASGNVCGGLLLANGSSITGQANCGIRGTYEYNSGRDLEFFTSADNSTAPTTKMQLKGNGNLALGNQIEPQGDNYLLSAYGTVVTCWFENRSTTAAHEVMILNRKESAGVMIAFLYNDAEKGTISQSGGTISYNAFMGSHYTESSEDVSSILLGTVMETVDALVENKYEDQKRLTKCKVSSTSESPNVYGVWIEDNETGQMAALGASWCRINSGVTVSMGDLLVSNGDGTAKVQSDDIIRSKTIGKVTSTVKKETYSDGSYVVPVVLYCG